MVRGPGEFFDKLNVHGCFDPIVRVDASLLKLRKCRLHPPSPHAGLLLSPLEFFLCLCSQSTVLGCTCPGCYKSLFADESGGTTTSRYSGMSKLADPWLNSFKTTSAALHIQHLQSKLSPSTRHSTSRASLAAASFVRINSFVDCFLRLHLIPAHYYLQHTMQVLGHCY